MYAFLGVTATGNGDSGSGNSNNSDPVSDNVSSGLIVTSNDAPTGRKAIPCTVQHPRHPH